MVLWFDIGELLGINVILFNFFEFLLVLIKFFNIVLFFLVEKLIIFLFLNINLNWLIIVLL